MSEQTQVFRITPNKTCIACKGVGTFENEPCVCTIVEYNIIKKLVENIKGVNATKKAILLESAFILCLLGEKSNPKEIDELELFFLTHKHRKSLNYIMLNINTTEELQRNTIMAEHTEPKKNESNLEIHLNKCCLSCNSFERKMYKVEEMFFCHKCAEKIFKVTNIEKFKKLLGSTQTN